MPTYSKPADNADEAREALRAFAHATRAINDPTDIYSILGAVTSGLASLAQALHQLGEFHDGPRSRWALVGDDHRAGRAASYQVSWELHRSAEMLQQVTDGVARAHEIEATIAYDPRRNAASANLAGTGRRLSDSVSEPLSGPGVSL
ncbi:hypothetical protein JCM18899A_14090 [Nocardioides sp. AN3]